MTNLTDKWKKGELLSGIYWVKYKTGFIEMEEYITHHNGFCYDEKNLIKEVLDEVPSFKEWQDLKSKLQLKETAYDFDTARLEEENTKLKELLKQAYPLFNYKDVSARTEFEKEWLAKAKKILGEE